ncbi:MAG TPA: sensor domain-containing diguanylate cyclase [Polyangiaceae bacterium]|jgi:diguanylate cyclase (GGDEF)-like protein
MSHDAITDILALLQLTEQLTDGRPLEDALRAVTDTALAILPGDHASIRLVDGSGSQLLLGARSGTGRDTPVVRLGVGEGISGWVLSNGKPARIVDVQTDHRFKNVSGQGFHIASMVAEPLVSEGVTIGILAISSPEVNAFSQTDELLARLLANCSVAPIQRARLERLALTDDLTLAYNSRYLGSRLREEMDRSRRSSEPLSVLLMDLDHFKSVNDTHGHAVGDRVLRAFVERVRSATRRLDLLVRRGGEEFVLIMPATTAKEAGIIAERIRQTAASTPIEVDTAKVAQTVSIGVATWDGRESPEALERRADAAMYEAKGAGRDRVVQATVPSEHPASER